MSSRRFLHLALVAVLVLGETGPAAARTRRARRKAAQPQSPAATAPARAAVPERASLPPTEISRRLTVALSAAKASKPDPGDPLAADRARFVASINRVGYPFAVRNGGQLVKYVVPALTRSLPDPSERVCGYFHVDPANGTVLAWPPFRPGAQPAMLLSEAEALARLEQQRGMRFPEPHLENGYQPIPVADPARLPGVYLIRGWDRQFAKLQDPLIDRVAQMNASGRLRQPLRYGPGQLDPPLKSIAAGASVVADWWRSRMEMPPLTHTGWLTGLAQAGVDPREIEVQYRHRGLACLPLAFVRDPVTGESVTLGLEGFCKVLTEVREPVIAEPLERAGMTTPTTYAAAPWRYGMEAEYLEVLSREMRDRYTVAENAGRIESALRAHGILLIRFDSTVLRRKSYALHGGAAIGKADINGKPCVLIAEVSCDRGIDFPLAGDGRLAYRAIPVDRIYTAYAFPHHVKLSLTRRTAPGQFDLRSTNAAGGPLDMDALDVRLGGALSVGVSLGGRTPHGFSVMRRDRGRYRITIPRAAQADPTARLIVAADCEHFREPGGRTAIGSYELSQLPAAPPGAQ